MDAGDTSFQPPGLSSPQEGPMPIVLHSSRDLSDEFVQMYSGKLPAPGTGLASANHSGPGPGLVRAPLHREPWMHFVSLLSHDSKEWCSVPGKHMGLDTSWCQTDREGLSLWLPFFSCLPCNERQQPTPVDMQDGRPHSGQVLFV